MGKPSYPTPYADVNLVVHEFQTNIQAILRGHFRGMYLFGSLALGDFDPHRSDIDFVVVTDAELDDDLFVALGDMHTHFTNSPSPWAEKIEAVYIPQDALRHHIPSPAQYPQIERDRPFFKDHLEDGWPVQCHILREKGIVVAGPAPLTLLDPVDPDDMRRASIAIAKTWLAQSRDDPEWRVWLQNEGDAFVVLTLCRLLYTIDTGDVTSKPAAARWAQNALGQRWADLIERSLYAEHTGTKVSDGDVSKTIALIQFTVEQGQRFAH